MKTTDLAKVRATLWSAADELRANSKLTPVQYRDPVLGLVFLAYAENRFETVRGEVEAESSARNPATVADYKAKSVLYVPDESRLSHLVDLPEGTDIGKAADEAIKAIEEANPELKDILPRGYQKLERSTLIELLRLFAPLPTQLAGDAFGFIYEEFLSNFAAQEGRGGGEYFTPYSIVRLIVEVLQPFHGRVFDPACGSGGMFVQCAKFVERHHESASRQLSVFGTEKTEDTVPLAKMNLALHGLSGDIRQANSYYENPHSAVGAFDYVMANPPFNVDKIKKDQLAGDKRFPFGLPKVDNGNFLWIQQFYAALCPRLPTRSTSSPRRCGLSLIMSSLPTATTERAPTPRGSISSGPRSRWSTTAQTGLLMWTRSLTTSSPASTSIRPSPLKWPHNWVPPTQRCRAPKSL